jgi:hypothetical protein
MNSKELFSAGLIVNPSYSQLTSSMGSTWRSVMTISASIKGPPSSEIIGSVSFRGPSAKSRRPAAKRIVVHSPGFRESNWRRMRSAGTIIRISTFVLATRTRTLASLSSFNHRGFGFDIFPPDYICVDAQQNLQKPSKLPVKAKREDIVSVCEPQLRPPYLSFSLGCRVLSIQKQSESISRC